MTQHTHNDDPFSGPDWQELVESALTGLVPKLKASANSVSLAPDGADTDVKFALELGFSIMLGKPLVVLKDRTRTLAPGLAKVADKVIELDMSNDTQMQLAMMQVAAWGKDKGLM